MSSYHISTPVTLIATHVCTQYIHGLVDDNDLESLRSYSSKVTEFILTDVDDVKNVKPIISPSTFWNIAQFLEPNSGLLPSLLRLRIIQADIYFPCLHLLHTSSLRTLEANVPDHQHPNFFSFLTTLVHKAPLLEEIILGQGQFPLKSLQAILKFTYLRHLELRDATSTINFTFLQDVGTLSNLESFILDARSCKYTARIPEKEPSKTPPAEHTEAGSQMPPPSSDINDDSIGFQGVSVYHILAAQYTMIPQKSEAKPSIPRQTSTAMGLLRLSIPLYRVLAAKSSEIKKLIRPLAIKILRSLRWVASIG